MGPKLRKTEELRENKGANENTWYPSSSRCVCYEPFGYFTPGYLLGMDLFGQGHHHAFSVSYCDRNRMLESLYQSL